MKYSFFSFLLFICAIKATAQRNLSGSIQHSVYTYIFKINPKEAEELIELEMRDVNVKYLHSLLDSFKTFTEEPNLKQGNYLFVYAKNNQVVYQLRNEGNIDIKLINNDYENYILVHTKEGSFINDADVFSDKHHLLFNNQIRAYGPLNGNSTKFIKVYYKGVFYSFPVSLNSRRKLPLLKRLKYLFPLKYLFNVFSKEYNHRYSRYNSFFNGSTTYERKYKGFIIFNKPKYKPGDTVELKAFIETNKGNPLKSPLLLRLTNRDLDKDTILSKIVSYRPGGYIYHFILTDSLNLDLDEEYLITLEEVSGKVYNKKNKSGNLDDDEYALKRKVVVRGRFSYEDYELNQLITYARSNKKEHSRGEEIALFLKATDENDLSILDGRVKIIVEPENYGTKSFHATNVFLPDTLWFHEQNLENLGETKIIIPDSIFPRVSFEYQIKCIFLNSNNEIDTKTIRESFKDENQSIEFSLNNDSLSINYMIKGKVSNASADLYVFGLKDDTIGKERINIPTTFKINSFAASYEVVTDSLDENYNLVQSKGMVSCIALRTKDSIAIKLINPSHLPVWYTIFAGKKIQIRGSNDTLFYSDKIKTVKNYFVSLQYIFSNHIYKENYTIPFQDKLLTIKSNQPGVVYPGQNVQIEVNVTDKAGKPVQGVDITAYAFTTKFKEPVPNIPYLGKIYPLRKQKSGIYIKEKEELEQAIQMNWISWSKELHLDTIEYYNFLHPKGIYINTEPAPDSITQLAPFIVNRGNLLPVQLLYIDEKPVFFNQANKIQNYSFKATEGIHQLRIRTYKRQFRIDSIKVVKGMKNYISIDADSTYKNIHIEKVPDTLTSNEKLLWKKYMILITNNFGENLAYVNQNGNYFLLNNNQSNYQSSILAGPFSDNYANLIVKNKFEQEFEAEGNWHYTIIQGLIKQFQTNNFNLQSWAFEGGPTYNFHDFVLTKDEIDSLWQEYLDNRSANTELFYNNELSKSGNGLLQIGFCRTLMQKNIFIKNVILFRYDNPDFIKVMPGNSRDIGYLKPGKYRILFLLKKDHYFLKENLSILKNGINFYQVESFQERQPDSISKRIANIIEGLQKNKKYYSGNQLEQIKETINNGFLDVSKFTDQISGIVKASDGSPITGAIVMIKGTRISTLTDSRGEFNLITPAHGTIVISSIGYNAQEFRINPAMYYTISLRPMVNRLEEVVVVGYTSVRRKDLTGSISSVSANNFLAGNAAGLLIRGTYKTEPTNAPLIIVNGLPYSGKLEDLDQNLILKIEVLKFDDAKALYGENAKGGVILVTTKDGKTNTTPEQGSNPNSIRHNFRDYAYWKPTLISDKNGNAYFNVTFPDDITNWKTFVIAMGNKKQTGFNESSIRSFKILSSTISVPQFAVLGDSISVIGKTLNYLPDPIQVKRSFFVNDHLIKGGSVHFQNSWIDTFSVTSSSLDSLKLKYIIEKENNYSDGEERSIPVFKVGVLQTNGLFASLDSDTSFQVKFSNDTSEIKVYAETSLLPVLYKETENIDSYEYLCNEQLASKLKAMLVQKRIDEYLKRPFKGDHIIRQLIAKLNNNRAASGLWGWWLNNEGSLWISLHVVEALLKAQQSGYSFSFNKSILVDYLIYNMESFKQSDKIFCLYLLRQLDAKPDFKKYIEAIDDKLSLFDKLRLEKLKLDLGFPILLDSLISLSKNTALGNLYWGEDNTQFFDNSIENSLNMYKILRKTGTYNDLLKKIRNYFLEKRNQIQWRNTYESSLILETILPDILEEQKNSKPLSLTVKTNDSLTITSFPYSGKISNSKLLYITKTGKAPLYFTAYQQYWNTAPGKVNGNFIVNSSFEKDGQTISSLKAGDPIILKVRVSVIADADYVLIEVPIPAGCSYLEKNQSYYNGEVHREYFKNKVCIFCKSLNKGEHIFTISLQPRFTGVYTLNPSKAEMMYFPTFFGRESIRKVQID